MVSVVVALDLSCLRLMVQTFVVRRGVLLPGQERRSSGCCRRDVESGRYWCLKSVLVCVYHCPLPSKPLSPVALVTSNLLSRPQ